MDDEREVERIKQELDERIAEMGSDDEGSDDEDSSGGGILAKIESEIESVGPDEPLDRPTTEERVRPGDEAGYTTQPRAEYVEELGEEIVSAVEDAVESNPVGEPGVAPGAPRRAVERLDVRLGGLQRGQTTDEHDKAIDTLLDTVTSGNVAGVLVDFAPERSCPVFTEETRVPILDNPATRDTRASAQLSVCARTDDWIRANNSNPDSRGGPGQLESILAGVSRSSVTNIREALREPEPTVDKGYVKLNADGSFKGQEGRNRAVAAKLEGFTYVNTMIVVVGESRRSLFG